MFINAKQVHLNLYASDPEYREEYDRLGEEFQEIRKALKMRDKVSVKTGVQVRDTRNLKTDPRVRDKGVVKTTVVV